MAATADYLAAHPFASPDIVLPPEAPLYRYRPDINTTTDLKTLETDLLGPGSRVDVIVGGLLDSYVLQLGTPTGAADEVVPNDYDAVTNHVYWKQILVNGTGTGVLPPIDFGDISGQISESQLPPGSVVDIPDPGVDALYFWNFATQVPQLITSSAAASFISPNINLSDLGGRITTSQLPAGSIASLDDPNVDAVYFWDNTANTPTLVNSDQLASFLSPSLDFSLISGSISISQLPPGTVATISDPGFNSVYYWDESLSAPALVSADDLATFLSPSLSFSLISGTLSLSQFPAGTIETLSSIGEDAVYFYDDALAEPRLMGVTELTALVGGGGGGSGDVVGPSSSVDSEIVLFDSTTGKLVKRATGSGLVKATSGVYSTITDSSSNWDTAYTERHQWDGGSTNLTAATGRTSLGLGTLATQSGTFSGTSSGTNTGDQTITLTGNVTGSGTGSFAATIANSAVTLAKMADIATSSLIYRKTAGTGAPEVNTLATLKTDLGLTGTNSGDQDLSSYATTAAVAAGYQPLDSDLTTLAGLTATTNNFIVSVASAWASRTPTQVKTTLAIANTDVSGLGTLSTQSGTFSGTSSGTNTGDQTITLTGDVTGSGTGSFAATIATGAVTDAKASLLVKPAVTVVAASNVTLSGEQTIDGTLTASSLVLATAQSTGSENGPWVTASGAWTRPTWYTAGSTTQAPQFLTTFVRLGTTYQGSTWRMTTASVTINTTSTTWTQTPTNINSVTGTLSGSSVSGGTFGAVNGSALTSLTAANITASTSTGLNFLNLANPGSIAFPQINADNSITSNSASAQRTALGLVIGTNVQAWDADLDTWSGITPASGVGTFLATPTSANLLAAMTDETGTGACVFATSPTLVTPLLGTPTSGDLRNCSAATDSITGVLSSADHTTLTSLSGFATGVAPTTPVGVPFIANKTGVDLKTNGTTTIFTVPSAKTFVFALAWVVVTAVTSGAAVAFNYKIQESGSGAALSQNTAAASNAPVLTKTWTQGCAVGGSPFAFCATGNNVVLNITVGFTTSTSVTGSVFVMGFYI